jgi:myo-inositol 2-dehydrogenase/D-chiro-inositol 1-dehydrogenase
MSHDRSAHVVGVIVGGENTSDGHSIGCDSIDEICNAPSRIDEEALTGFSVSDGVGEVDHLGGECVTDGEVSPGEQLAEVEAFIGHVPSVRSWLVQTDTDTTASRRSDTVRYGVIGTGMMGVEHIENIAHLDGAVVTAVSDPVAERRAIGSATVRSFGGDAPIEFDDHRALLDSGLVDAVVIASPNMTHVDVLGDVLDSGVHVMVEKPLCTTVQDCRRVVAAAASGPANRVVWMGLEYRYMPPTTALLGEVRSGSVGNVKMVAIREHRFPFLVKVGNWNRFSRNTGGTLVEKCCHFFDLMRLVADSDPVRVMASGGQDVNHLDEVYDGEVPDILDNAYVIVEFANGVRGMLDLCMFAEASVNEQEISVTGDEGKVEALVTQSLLRVGRRSDGSHVVAERPIVADGVRHVGLHHGASYLEHVDFIESVRAGRPAAVTLGDGLWSVAMGVAAHRSIERGAPVMIDEVMADG